METIVDRAWEVLNPAPHPEKELDERSCQEGFSERFGDGSVGSQACHHLPPWEDKGWQAKGVVSCGAPPVLGQQVTPTTRSVLSDEKGVPLRPRSRSISRG